MNALAPARELEVVPAPPGEASAPAELMRTATDVAGLAKKLVLAASVQIEGKRYVQVEGWTAVAALHGYLASSDEPEQTESGWRCRGSLKRMSDGVEVAHANGFVGKDEARWEKRPEYARKGMAQTRAISRVCKSAFSYVVLLMNAGLQTTPAEEMMGEADPEPRNVTPPAPERMPKGPAHHPPPAPPPEAANPGPVVTTNAKGQHCWTGRLDRVEEKYYDDTTYWQLHLGPKMASTWDAQMGDAALQLKGTRVELVVTPAKKQGLWKVVDVAEAAAEVKGVPA